MARDSIFQLRAETHTCSAFAIAPGRILTAAHCKSTDIVLIDSKGREFTARVIKEDKAKDLLLLEAPTNAPALDIWNDFWQGGLVPGTEIIALGYPGYYGSYTWEHGYVKEIREMPAFGEVVVSKDISFPGLSGGAVIDIRRGKVVGMVVAVAEDVKYFNSYTHQHNSISILVSYYELTNLYFYRSLWLRQRYPSQAALRIHKEK